MTRLYIAGPMTGLPDFNYPAFFEAETALLVAGYDIENPARNKPEGTAAWLAYMRLSLVQIARSDGIASLPGWESSRGASVEINMACEIGIPVYRLDEWIEQVAVSR